MILNELDKIRSYMDDNENSIRNYGNVKKMLTILLKRYRNKRRLGFL